MESDSGKLFIGGISWDTNEDRLREYFEGFGEVVEAVIMKDRTTGRARGFGFVVFADPSIAEKVVMQKHMIDGRMVEAKKAVPRDDQQILTRNSSSSIIHGSPGPSRTKKIFVGGLPSTVTEPDFKRYFDQFGTVTDVVVMYDHNTQRHRGFGFITYDTEDAVDKALFKTFHELNGKMVEVKRAVPKELSPGPNTRIPVSGYNFGLNRMNTVLNGYTQGYNPSIIGSYGVRMDGRFGPLGSGRNGFPSLGPGYGIRLNFEPGMSPNYGGNTNFSNTLGYSRALSPYFGGNSSRYTSPIGYGGLNGSNTSVFNSAARNLVGNSNFNYTTNSTSSNAYMASGSGSLGGFGNGGLTWGGSSPLISAHDGGNGASYANVSLGYETGDNSFSLGNGSLGRGSENGFINTSLTAPSNRLEGDYADLYGGSSIYGDPTWRSASSELDGSGPFGYGLSNAASDVSAKTSSGYMGSYNVTNRQTNRGR